MNKLHSNFKRFIEVIKQNKIPLLGSYASEMAFYIIWALVPIMLVIANVIVILPVSQEAIISVIRNGLPEEVSGLLVPLLESYTQQVDKDLTGMALGILISLWPASNVFNTLQRVLNSMYNAVPRKTILARAFAYLFTLAFVVVYSMIVILMLVGERILDFLETVIRVKVVPLEWLVSQSWLFAICGLFLLLMCIYHFIPNVDWKWQDSLVGATLATLGFVGISQLLSFYIDYAARNVTSNNTIGVFISLMIWLYFNCLAVMVGAYVNLIWYKYRQRTNELGKVR